MMFLRNSRRLRTESQIRTAFAGIQNSRLGPQDRYVYADWLLDKYLELKKSA